MNNNYIDYPDNYSDVTIETLNQEYSKKAPTPLSFLQLLQKENNMKPASTLQNEDQSTPVNPNQSTNQQPSPSQSSPNPTTPSNTPNEDFRLYSLISSNYCNLTNLFNNIIAKTSSSKRETYQEINASLRVDQTTFNNTFYTTCNMERYNFCNYNQLIYTTIENFIDLVENLSNLAIITANTAENPTVIRLRNNAYFLFRQFVGDRPIRY